MQKNNRERGVALIIIFLMVTIMVGIVLGVNAILLKKVNLLSDIGNASVALDAAQIGMEKISYHIKNGNMCSLRNNCSSGNSPTSCEGIDETPLAPGGCNPNECDNCRVTFYATWGDITNNVSAAITDCENLNIQSTATLTNGTSRTITENFTNGGSGGGSGGMFSQCAPPLPPI